MSVPETGEWTGGCLCRAVRYRATKAPVRAVICHCEMCRKVSEAPLLAFVHFPLYAFEWTEGEPSYYRSSAEAERGFCSTCGSTVSMKESVLGDRVQVSLGSLDRPGDVTPDDHVWTRSQLPWLHIDDDLPRYPRNSPAAPSHAPHAD
jgi:hypothetical protein